MGAGLRRPRAGEKNPGAYGGWVAGVVRLQRKRLLVLVITVGCFFALLPAVDPSPIQATPVVETNEAAAVVLPRGDIAPRIRKNVKNLTPKEQRNFTSAVLAMKNTPSPWNRRVSYYDQFVLWHKQAFSCSIMAAHMAPSFLPWHRKFLILFENALRQVSGKPITVPYWDWTDARSTAAVFKSDFMGGSGKKSAQYAVVNGRFRKGNWKLNIRDPKVLYPTQPRHLVRRFGTPLASTLPTRAQVSEALARPNYDVAPFDAMSDPDLSFRNYLEGWRDVTAMTCDNGFMDVVAPPNAPHMMHNRVHIWVGGVWKKSGQTQEGSMTLNTSPNDPVFWLHHSNIDRLWAQWGATHSYAYAPVSGQPSGQNLNDTMWPYNTIGIRTKIADLLRIRTLGYSYAN